MSNNLNIKPALSQGMRTLELEHGILLSNNYYQKDDLNPVSMIGVKYNASTGSNVLGTKTYMFLNTGVCAGLRHHDFGIIPDPYILDRYYIKLNSQHSNANPETTYIGFVDDNGKDAKIIEAINIPYVHPNYFEIEKILDITEKYIFISARSASYYDNIYIYAINKLTKALTCIKSFVQNSNTGRSSYIFIRKNETFLYFITRTNYTVWTLTELDKENFTFKDKTINSGTRSYTNNTTGVKTNIAYSDQSQLLWDNYIVNESFYQEDGKYYLVTPLKDGVAYPNTTGDANDNLVAYCYDTNVAFDDTNAFTIKKIPIQNTEIKWLRYSQCTGMYRFWVIDNYLYYGIYDEANTSAAFKAVQGVHVFKILPGFELEWQSVQRISSTQLIISMIFNSDRSILIAGYWQSFEILKRNETTGEYEPMNKTVSGVMNAGFDALDRLWYQKLDNTVHVQNLDDPCIVNMKFERNYYTYEGTPINTFITFEAANFLAQPAYGKYVLTLSGNAKFQDSGTYTHEFIYSGGLVQINMTVYGPERITCNTKFIKVW